MKTILTLFLTIQIFNLVSQTNYYLFKSKTLNLSAPSFKVGTKIVVDSFGKTYYVSVDGRICFYWFENNYWNYGFLSLNMPQQRSKQLTGIKFQNNSLFFVNENNDLSRFYYENNNWNFEVLNSASPKVLAGSEISTDEFGKVYYVSSDGRICNFWRNGAVWNYAYLGNNTFTQKSKQYTGLEYKNLSLFFVNQNNDVSRFYYLNGSWNHQVLNTNAEKVLIGTQITTDEFGKVYYVSSNNSIVNLYPVGNDWNFDILNVEAPKAKQWTDIKYYNNQLFYVGNDNKMCVLYFGVCNWNYKCINSIESVANLSSFAVGQNNKIFYVNSSLNKVCELYPEIDLNHPFVYLKGNDFMNGNNLFDLKVLNYIVDFNSNDNMNYWASPCISYDNFPSTRLCNNKFECLNLLRTHFNNIKSYGFNTIRICGLAPYPSSADLTSTSMFIDLISAYTVQSSTKVQLTNSLENKLLVVIEEVLNIANDAGLKVILLTGSGGNKSTVAHDSYSNYLERLSFKLKNNETLLAYDIYNEPANHNSLNKQQICSSVNNWYSSIRINDKRHLITLGNQTATDVLSWDPSLLSVDFLSFHLYPMPSSTDVDLINDPLNRVYSDIKWISDCSKKINKPWVIGETGFAADLNSSLDTGNDWGTEENQDNFARQTIKRTKDCGGKGYSWWQYHDVFWGSPTQDYLGLLSHNDTEKKIVTNQTFKTYLPVSNCFCPVTTNYYNYYNFNQFSLNGRVLNASGIPLKNAVIFGWEDNDRNGAGFMTYSDNNGYFNLKSNKLVISLVISDLGFENKDLYFSNSSNNYSIGSVVLNKFSSCNPLVKAILSNNIFETEDKVFSSDVDLKESNLDMNVVVFPNPAYEIVNIESNYIINNLSVFDIQGRLICFKMNKSNSLSIDCSEFSKGIYYFQIKLENEIICKKIIIEK